MNERWATGLICSETGEKAPLDEPAFLSSAGKPWLVEYELDPGRGEWLKHQLPQRPWSLWRYQELLPLMAADRRVDLGEGATPLFPLQRVKPAGVELLLKEEGGNPTGSFKARGLSLAVNRARELGASGVQLASAGNAALALAAYAAAAGLPCRVALPQDTPRTVFERCQLYGAEVLSSPGTLVEAGHLLAEREGGFWTLSTLREPYRVEGKKTMGLELAEQMGWRLPDWIVYPTGGGTGIIGMHRAFEQLERLGLLSGRRPRFVVVQMEGCAPIVRAFERGESRAEAWADAETRAWGLRVPQAIGDFLILEALQETAGQALSVSESATFQMMERVAREEGHLVGPEGAAALLAVEQLAARGTIEPAQSVVVFQTGHPANYV